MRTCFYCHGDKLIEVGFQHESDPLTKDYIVSGIVEPCYMCNGSGEVEEGCYCHAYCSCECICGAWDDVECTCKVLEGWE